MTETADSTDLKGRCIICHETPDELNQARVPSCNHIFCAGCIVSWGSVRGLCALCRAPFTSVYVNRSLDGTPCSEPTLEPVTLLQRASWVSAVTVSPDLDTFAPPPADLQPLPPERSNLVHPGSSSRAAPYYRDERVEDELEEMFWAEEEKNYRELSRRSVGNRPFGANGFMSSGRRVARAPTLTRRQKAAAAAAASSSSSQQAPARRKKKVKKNSRAGRLAAQASQVAQANNNDEPEQDGDDGLRGC